VTAAIYVGLGIFAYYQLREARRLRDDQSRPFVVVDFAPGWLLKLEIENIGKVIAQDVRFKFTPPLQSTRTDYEEVDLLSSGASMIPPGRKFRIFFDVLRDRLESDLPRLYQVQVTYYGPGRQGKPYVDHYTIDTAAMRGTLVARKGISEVAASLEEISKVLKRHDGFGGLNVVTSPAADRSIPPRREARPKSRSVHPF
jgi:hypothetical protein